MSPCTWFVLIQFSRSCLLETTILVCHLLPLLTTTFEIFSFFIILLFVGFFLSMKLENRLKGDLLPSFFNLNGDWNSLSDKTDLKHCLTLNLSARYQTLILFWFFRTELTSILIMALLKATSSSRYSLFSFLNDDLSRWPLFIGLLVQFPFLTFLATNQIMNSGSETWFRSNGTVAVDLQ